MTDLIIIGSGGAGLSAALEAKKQGLSVKVISKTYPTMSQTSQAQGGINACLDPQDNTIDHFNDTMKSAHKIGDEKTIKFMCEEAPKSIKWLDDLGVPFSKNEHSHIAQRKLGGASFPRACYSSDYTGLKILHTLYDQCLKNNIEFINEHMLLDLIKQDNKIIGVVTLDIKTNQVKEFYGNHTVIASGGYAGVYSKYNTNSNATTADAISIAYDHGCELANLEYVQFHPTSLIGSCILISESARGEGGYLIDQNNERFVDELKPRDEVARAIYTKIQNGDKIYLDLRHLGLEKIQQSMPQEYDLIEQFAGLKADLDLIPITPAAHYTMGGIKTDINGKTSVKNLFAIGEVANNGVHGANRLGGNSLLEIVTFGRKTAQYIAKNISADENSSENLTKIPNEEKILELFHIENRINFYEIKEALGKLFYENVGLFREKNSLEKALAQVEIWIEQLPQMGLEDKSTLYNTNLKERIEFEHLLKCAKLIVSSALYRKESRGAHYRSDFPQEKEEFDAKTIISKIDNQINIKLVK